MTAFCRPMARQFFAVGRPRRRWSVKGWLIVGNWRADCASSAVDEKTVWQAQGCGRKPGNYCYGPRNELIA